MWYSILDILYSPFLIQIIRLSSGEYSDAIHFGDDAGTTVNHTRPCPKTNETTSVRIFYYANPPDPARRGCYDLRSKEACGENMRFYEVDDIFGDCDCDDSLDGHNAFRTLIYHKETNKCYPIFTQGYCEPGKWLDFTEPASPTPVCTQNPCYNEATPLENNDMVLVNGTCVEVGSQSSCGPGQIIGFQDGQRLAQCVPRRLLLRSIAPSKVKCRPGTYRASSGKCQPAFDIFD